MASLEELESLLETVTEASRPLVESGQSSIQAITNSKSDISADIDPSELRKLLDLDVPNRPGGKALFDQNVKNILSHSANTWSQGFLQKLYGSTDAPGVAAELMLAFLNQNVHVFEAAPALTLVEKFVGRKLAGLFGLDGPEAGRISVQGGSASNTMSIVIARNTLYPKTKTEGNSVDGLRLVLLTSAHGHSSVEKAAQMLGLGSSAVHSIPVTDDGRMDAKALEQTIIDLILQGFHPFYVNGTAGTTVLGSYDPIAAIANVCQQHKLWLHIDASWGGPAIFSEKQSWKLDGSHLADSIAINPHKMMGVPLTCSFLLGRDLRKFQAANTLRAEYLFHGDVPTTADEMYDLADLTLQCGRRGDSLKLYMSWVYHGSDGYRDQIDNAFSNATYLAELARDHPDIMLVSESPPPCLQVCFFFAKAGQLHSQNSRITQNIAKRLKTYGFLIDHASIDSRGSFLRPVIHPNDSRTTLDTMLDLIVKIGDELWERDMSE